MKNKILSVLLLALLLLFSLSVFAQDSPFDELVKKYENEDGFTTVVISGEMFDLFANIDPSEENKEINNLMQSLSAIKILNFDKSKYKAPKLDFYYKIIEDLPKDKYVELMTVKEKDQNVKFYIRKLNTGKIGEMIMISGGDDDNTMISISGQIDLHDMSKLSHSLGIKGLENLKELEDHEEAMQQAKQELEKAKQEIQQQKQELEKQRQILEEEMRKLEEEKRK